MLSLSTNGRRAATLDDVGRDPVHQRRGNTILCGAGAGATKTARGVRPVPVPAFVLDQLRAHRTRQAAERLASAYWEDAGLVVTTEIGGMVEPRAVSRAWRAWAKKAGLADTGTHLGRHYAATTLMASGTASLADVGSMLGQDPSVLLTTYANAAAAGQRRR